ncbi:hypothetical protein A3Q56_05180 [Intoshia linei]|uniref:Tc1-like transposase DDE domain-containing protein n=1 Tax=Intoshia linei TaxID=1819745 RepID=A0A177B023_9BILA|nr:hypothetical protein A3Q56_05180 [Intoshia linei]
MACTVNSLENKLRRVPYIESLLLARANGRTIIWIHECNFNLFSKRKEGRSNVGSRATVITASSKGSNLHCIAALSSTRMYNFKTHQVSFKGDDYNNWLRELINITYELGVTSPTFVIGNDPVHRKIESVVRVDKDVEMIRLAPYSYLLNPFELA